MFKQDYFMQGVLVATLVGANYLIRIIFWSTLEEEWRS